MAVTMVLGVIELLYGAVLEAIDFGVYGWIVGVFWLPFLVAEDGRGLFDAFPTPGRYVNYVLLIPVPAILWGFCWKVSLPLLLELQRATGQSSYLVANTCSVLVASLLTLGLWSGLLLCGLPARGVDWRADRSPRLTAVLVVGSGSWYVLVLAAPTLAFSALVEWSPA